MHKLLLGVLFSTFIIESSAVAADVSPAPVLKAPPVPIAERWTGAYFGFHAGYAHAHSNLTVLDSPGVFVPDAFNLNGFIGGMQIGANRQIGNLVAGVELSLSGSTVSGSKAPCFLAITPAPPSCKSELEWLALATGRVGFAHDSWMVYAIGGWAMTSFTDRQFPPAIASGAPVATGVSDMRSGPAFGAGVEMAISPTLSAGVEYVHVSFAGGHANFSETTTSREVDLVRARLNLKLGRGNEAGWMWGATGPDIWTGAYFGLHAGYAWGRIKAELAFIDEFSAHDSWRNNGGLVGAQLGMNRQIGNLVLGAELSLSDIHARGGKQQCFIEGAGPPGANCQSEINWLLVGIARLGYAHGNVMPYLAVGPAVGGVTDMIQTPGQPERIKAMATTLPGIAFGGGIEADLGRGFVAGIEYLHVNFNSKPLVLFSTGTDRDVDLVRGRLSVKLDACCDAAYPSGMPTKAPAPSRVTQWGGVYAGGFAGYGWGNDDHTDTRFLSFSVPPPTSYRYGVSGGVAGGFVGMNVQRGNIVFGGEISLGGADIKGSLTDCVVRGAAHNDCRTKVDALLTAMGRVGYAQDSWLVYATAGWAVANIYFESRRTDPSGIGFGPFAADNSFGVGPAFGAGIEFALGNGFSTGVEYLRANLSTTSQPAFNGSGTGDRDLGLNVVRGRLSYRFN